MTEWSAGDTVGLDRVLYRDGRAVGMVDSPEIALEIVAAMRVVDRMIEPSAESGRERSPAPRDGQKLNPAGVAAIPGVTSSTPPAPPRPPAGSRWLPSENCYCGPPDMSLYPHRHGTGMYCGREQRP